MRSSILMLCGIIFYGGCGGSHEAESTAASLSQDEVAMPYESFTALKQHLKQIRRMEDPQVRDAALDELWAGLHTRNQFPFVDGQSVAFLYRGEARSVTFTGDFNSWDPSSAHAKRLDDTDLWIQEESFPLDARLDYKVVLDGSRWLLDPENPRIQRSGFGDNSELPMPGYTPSPYVVRQDGTPRGQVAHASLASSALGYTVNYQVYTPAGYDHLSDLPVIYVTDGHNYADDAMGSMLIVLDNLIAQGRVRPMLAVFIDPRVNGQNRRSEQYVLNESFVRCVADELVPAVDGAYRTSTDRSDRGILGTSLGGLNSAWFALRATATFKRIGIQSPAFHAGDGAIVGLYRESPPLDVDIFMSWGTFRDFGETSRRFQAILDAKGYDYTHVVVNEGHSWGNWRALLDDLLVAFWPAR